MERQVNRRRFLGAAAGTGALATFGAIAPAAQAKRGRHSDSHGGWGRGRSGRVPRDRRGIQLYTLREKMRNQDEARAMLLWLGDQGYSEVETAGHYGWTAEQFRAELRRAGLRAPAGHDGPNFDDANWRQSYPATLEYAAALGQTHTGLAYQGGPHTEEHYRQLAQNFNEAAAMAREYDLTFFYHNHDFEFTNKQSNGAPLYDILLAESDRELVKFELDLYWITEGGANGVEYLSADPSRYFGYHVKDHVWGDRPDAPDWEDVGPGMLDFPDLFDAGDGDGRLDKHYFIEHDRPALSHPDDPEAEYKTARAGIEYLEEVRW